ncbi:putative pectinesterase/pectinesterase inhibitor 22 [Bienertia sinuspersici]
MRWHKDERDNDEIMRHPADSKAWKSFDEEYSSFADEARNVRLGLACDGFQPFDNSQHSIWPVVLIPYNLPPWICMKPHSFMLSLLIPGPTSPGLNIDVYLQPLIEELKELWEDGVETYDAYAKQNFNMRAMLLWTINDFPAYADLSGWSTKGEFACPSFHKDTMRTSLKSKGGYLDNRRWLPLDHKWRNDAKSFNNKKERRQAPVPLTGDEVLDCHNRFEQKKFGKVAGQKRKWDASNSLYGWRKKSIFFQLPYWRKLLIRHNLDVMHIEKNVSDNILGTLMNIKGKTKDTVKARIDLVKMGIRKELHPVLDGDKVRIPVASYTLNSAAKSAICDMFAAIKSPDGYLSNISRCVKDNGNKISCMKSHDHHIFIEQLLPLATRGLLPKNVYEPLVELSFFFRNLCSKNITMKELDELEQQIPYTLCKLEMVFPPAFFDVMVHLVVHLAAEAKIGGPVRYRWMYPIERYVMYTNKIYKFSLYSFLYLILISNHDVGIFEP